MSNEERICPSERSVKELKVDSEELRVSMCAQLLILNSRLAQHYPFAINNSPSLARSLTEIPPVHNSNCGLCFGSVVMTSTCS